MAERDRELLFSHRYLLSPAVTPGRFTAAGLKESLEDTVADLASPEGLALQSLVVRDPTGEMLAVVDQLSRTQAPRRNAGVWTSEDGTRSLLIADTTAAGSDTDGQEHALAAVRAAFGAAARAVGTPRARAVQLVMSGPGVFAVASRAKIERAVVRLSIASSAAGRADFAGGVPLAGRPRSGSSAGCQRRPLRGRRGGPGLWRGARHHAGVRRHFDRRGGGLFDLLLHPIGRRHIGALGAAPMAHDEARHAHVGVRLRIAPAIRISRPRPTRRVFGERLGRGRGGDTVRPARPLAEHFFDTRSCARGRQDPRRLRAIRAPPRRSLGRGPVPRGSLDRGADHGAHDPLEPRALELEPHPRRPIAPRYPASSGPGRPRFFGPRRRDGREPRCGAWRRRTRGACARTLDCAEGHRRRRQPGGVPAEPCHPSRAARQPAGSRDARPQSRVARYESCPSMPVNWVLSKAMSRRRAADH